MDPQVAAVLAVAGLGVLAVAVAVLAARRGRTRAVADAAELAELKERLAEAQRRAADAETRAEAPERAAGEPMPPADARAPGAGSDGPAAAGPASLIGRPDPAELGVVADSLVEGLVRIDADGTASFANLAAHALLERRPGSLVGRSAMEAFLDHRVEDVMATAHDRGSANAELPPRISDGRTIVVHARAVAGGAIWVVLEDVSELRRLQRIRAEFVDNLSHELRTPITNVNLLAEMLGRESEQMPPRARERVERIQVEAAHLAQMANELLDLAAIESGQRLLLANVDLALVARDQGERLRVFAERQGVRLVVDAPPSAPMVRGDAERLGQALLNLIHNAVKFSEPGDEVIVRVLPGPGSVVIRVIDEGAGIPRADVDRIFERFYKVDRARQRRSGGTGLGLAIVRHVAEAHGGTVTVASEEGEGSTFSVEIPLASSADALEGGLA
jgi:two-component system, OmpR family, phosphate regulon sensor histidine kinase PhoR